MVLISTSDSRNSFILATFGFRGGSHFREEFGWSVTGCDRLSRWRFIRNDGGIWEIIGVFLRDCAVRLHSLQAFSFNWRPPLELSLCIWFVSRVTWVLRGLSSCSRSYRSRCSPGSSSSQQQPQLIWKLRPEAAANEPWAFFFWTEYSRGLPSPTRGHHFPNCLIRSDLCLESILILCFCTGPKSPEVLCAGNLFYRDHSNFTCQL